MKWSAGIEKADSERGEMMDELKKAVLSLFQKVKKAWEQITALFSRKREVKKEIEHEKKMRSSWVTVRDTRKPSQVINKRPLFAIQKII